MNFLNISLDPIHDKTIAILGYGNQGAAHALNLRDSGIKVLVGSRPGKSFDLAAKDGFDPLPFEQAAEKADVVMFLLSDPAIAPLYAELKSILAKGSKTVGFAHGFAYHYGQIEILSECQYFLVGPKGAGAILRERFRRGSGLPGVFALGKGASEQTRRLCLAYAKAIGVASSYLKETTFQEETECDLFGEQAVLCGGLLQIMEKAFDTLVQNGHTDEMAFFECCFEVNVILNLWLKYGPSGVAERISPTAFYGGLTRGRRLVNAETEKILLGAFKEIQSGSFAREWQEEVDAGFPQSKKEKERLKNSALQKAYDRIKQEMGEIV